MLSTKASKCFGFFSFVFPEVVEMILGDTECIKHYKFIKTCGESVHERFHYTLSRRHRLSFPFGVAFHFELAE